MTRYLSVDQVLRIHGGLVDRPVVRELERIESAVQRPQAGWGDDEAYPTLAEKAAVLLHGLASTQGFEDGNKRTAWLSLLAFLAANGEDLSDIPVIEAESFAMAVAVSAWSDDTVPKAAEWIKHRLAIGPLQRRHPQLDYAIICGAASAHDGVLDMVSGGVGSTVAPGIPGVVRVAVAVRVFWTPRDIGRRHVMRAEGVHESGGEPIGGYEWSFPEPVGSGHPHHPFGLMPCVAVFPLELDVVAEGRHEIVLSVDEEEWARLPLNVVGPVSFG